jgi:hypothetical protein
MAAPSSVIDHPQPLRPISWLAQRPCPICPTAPGTATFPIEIPPWSHQVSRQIGKALKAALQEQPTFAQTLQQIDDGGVCLRLIFVLEDGASMKDCDNMAKGVVDAFQGLLSEMIGKSTIWI